MNDGERCKDQEVAVINSSRDYSLADPDDGHTDVPSQADGGDTCLPWLCESALSHSSTSFGSRPCQGKQSVPWHAHAQSLKQSVKLLSGAPHLQARTASPCCSTCA
jgi:hypothetical protein